MSQHTCRTVCFPERINFSLLQHPLRKAGPSYCVTDEEIGRRGCRSKEWRWGLWMLGGIKLQAHLIWNLTNTHRQLHRPREHVHLRIRTYRTDTNLQHTHTHTSLLSRPRTLFLPCPASPHPSPGPGPGSWQVSRHTAQDDLGRQAGREPHFPELRAPPQSCWKERG